MTQVSRFFAVIVDTLRTGFVHDAEKMGERSQGLSKALIHDSSDDV